MRLITPITSHIDIEAQGVLVDLVIFILGILLVLQAINR